MITTKPMSAAAPNDAELVHASLAGNREAFGRIVARYQALICALAYSATGSLSRSEELAQDTFVAAWKQRSALREPAKLRAWLCGIARHVISNAQRRAGREPAHLAEPFDPAHEAVAPEPSPSEQAVSQEEAALLWRALEKIPENYREPLVLFYREQRSVESVARELELSEDAVKQRLARGRALLHEQMLALVEGTLARSNPGRAFTLNVVAALPMVGAGLATAVGVGSTKSVGSAKSLSWLSPLAQFLTAQVLWFASSLLFVASIGGMIGWQMSGPAQSPAERRWALRFWRLFAGGVIGCVLPAPILENLARAHPAYAAVCALWLGVFYVLVGVPLASWAVANHRRIRAQAAVADGQTAADATGSGPEGTQRRWVAMATLAAVGVFTIGMFQGQWSERVRPSEVWGLIVAHPAAEIRIDEIPPLGRWVSIYASEGGKSRLYRGPLNEATYQLLKQSGRHTTTRVKGRDYDVLGWPARWFGPVAVLVIGAGLVILVRTPLRGKRVVAARVSPCVSAN